MLEKVALAGLQRQANLRAGLSVLVRLARGRGAVGGIPELRERIFQILSLFGSAAGDGQLLFRLQGAISRSVANALKLRGPGEGICLSLSSMSRMARPRELRSFEKLQGIAAIVLDEIVLQFAQVGNLQRDVPGIGYDGGDGDDQAEMLPVVGERCGERAME